MGRPASRMSVFRPFSVSSFAAQPPVIPEPMMTASYLGVGIFSPKKSGFPESGSYIRATMLRARNNLQFEFLRETNFRSVVTVDGNAFEDLPEFAFQQLFGKNFVDASSEQQLAQLRAIDDATLAGRVARAHHGNHVEPPDQQMKGEFWEVFKRITVHGYYTSEVGFSQELKLQIIPGTQHGCTDIGPGLGEA